MAGNTGKASEAIFEGRWDALGKTAWLERRIDAAHVRGLNRGQQIAFPMQPSDYILTHKGVTHYCEVKSSGNKTSFPLGQIEKGQWAAMTRVTAAGGSYLVFIHNTATDEWFKVPGSAILDHKKDSSSIPWDELRLLHRWFATPQEIW